MSQLSSKPMTKPKSEVDMSAAAIAARLEAVRGLYKLCMSLMLAGRQSTGRESRGS